MEEYAIFVCPQCKETYEDHVSRPECLVGGHWTPHSSDDKPPAQSYPCKCCHQHQRKLSA